MLVHPRHYVPALIAIVAVVGAVFATAAPAAGAAGTASGDLDADLVSGSGQVLGTLQGSVSGRHGFAVITPASRQLHPSWLRLTVSRQAAPRAGLGSVDAQIAGDTGGSFRLEGRGAGGVRLTLSLHGERLLGSGKQGRVSVSVAGYGGVPRPSVTRGTMLVIDAARLGLEARDSLRRSYTLKRALGRLYTRARVLADPGLLTGVAGAVVSSGPELRRLVRTGMLRALANAHRWVIVVSPGVRDLRRLRGILPVPRLRNRPPVVALRRFGVQGSSDAVRMVVVYPAGPTLTGHLLGRPGGMPTTLELSKSQAARLRTERVAAFVGQLARYGVAYARARGAVRAAQGAGGPSAECTQAGQTPASTAGVWSCYQVDVLQTIQLAVGPPGNVGPYCLWQPRPGFYCPGSSLFQSVAGSDSASPTAAQLAQGCLNATSGNTGGNGIMYPFAQSTVGAGPFSSQQMTQSAPVPTSFIGDLQEPYYDKPCPQATAQTATYETNDSYFALYEPFASQQGVLAVTNGELTPNTATETGGPLIAAQNGVYKVTIPDFGTPAPGGPTSTLPETAWFPGQVVSTVSYAPPPNAGPGQAFFFQQQNSFPQNEIQNTTQEQASTTTTGGWSLGIGADGPKLGWQSPGQSWTDATFVNVPDWSVVPNDETTNGQNSVFYTWQSVSPTSWSDMQCAAPAASKPKKGCGQPFGLSTLNSLNTNPWSPSSQTAWSGPQTGGTPTAGIGQRLSFVDHYTAFGEDPNKFDFFQIWQATASSSSTTTTSFGAQELDFCDPLVTPPGQTLALC
jgi:hypothetical protein